MGEGYNNECRKISAVTIKIKQVELNFSKFMISYDWVAA